MSVTLTDRVSNPDLAISMLKEGNIRFVKNLRLNRNLLQEIESTKEKQTPFAVVITCMDSRTSPELIFDRGLGDIFGIRIAGNVVTPEVLGSVEYACGIVGTPAVIVLGHTGCGAIQGTIDNVKLGSLPAITNRIRKCIHPHHSVAEVTHLNVMEGVRILQEESPVLRELVAQNKLKIIGGIYDITTGQVDFLDDSDTEINLPA